MWNMTGSSAFAMIAPRMRQCRPKCYAVLLLVFGFVLSACVVAPKPETVIPFFNDVAFRGSFGGYPVRGTALLENDYWQHRIYRWEDEILVRIDGVITLEYRARTEAAIRQMSEISRRPARILSPGEGKPNFVIEFLNQASFSIRSTETAPCFASSTMSEANTIRDVEIKISLEDPDLVNHCIVHEIFHGFGFIHSDLLRSVVSSLSLETEMTDWDVIALKTLYDSRLKSGMTRRQAMPIARRLILEHLAKSGMVGK